MADADGRGPFPPGEYPVVVVGSGPGGLQVSYFLRRHGIEHAVISADPAPGGMFRRWPFFQRLLSWTKPYAPGRARHRASSSATTGTACSPTSRSCARSRPSSWTARRTSRRGPRWRRTSPAFAERAGIAVRYGCRWERRGARTGPTARRSCSRPPTASTAGRSAFFAVGVAEPWTPSDARHRARAPTTPTRARPPSVRGQAAVHHRQAELRVRARDGPRAVGAAISVCVAVAGQDFDPDAVARRRPGALRAAVRGQLPRPRGLGSSTPRSTRAEHVDEAVSASSSSGPTTAMPMSVEADEVIAATGSPARCSTCPTLGVATFGAGEAAGRDAVLGERDACPASTSRARSARRRRASRSTASRPTPARSTGRGTTALILARHIAETHSASSTDRPLVEAADLRRLPAARGDARARAVAPEGVPRARRLGLARRGDPRRGHPAARPRAGRHGPPTWSR